jgi:predicted molibdopterin-dependent oxidoreductase YjgC
MKSAIQVEFTLDGQALRVPAGSSLAAAMALHGRSCTRISVTGESRAPVCGMGICQECRLQINGRRQLACQTICSEGMTVETGTRQGRK